MTVRAHYTLSQEQSKALHAEVDRRIQTGEWKDGERLDPVAVVQQLFPELTITWVWVVEGTHPALWPVLTEDEALQLKLEDFKEEKP